MLPRRNKILDGGRRNRYGALEGKSTVEVDGLRLDGEWKDGRLHGNCILEDMGRTRIEGAFRDGEMSGTMTKSWFFSDGKIKKQYIGDIFEGELCGYGELRSDNEVYTGDFKANKFHGKGLRIVGRTVNNHFEEERRFSGEFRYHQLHGEAIEESRHFKFQGTFKNNRRHTGKAYWSGGAMFEGDWQNTYRHGYGTYHCKKSDIFYKGPWLDDVAIHRAVSLSVTLDPRRKSSTLIPQDQHLKKAKTKAKSKKNTAPQMQTEDSASPPTTRTLRPATYMPRLSVRAIRKETTKDIEDLKNSDMLSDTSDQQISLDLNAAESNRRLRFELISDDTNQPIPFLTRYDMMDPKEDAVENEEAALNDLDMKPTASSKNFRQFYDFSLSEGGSAILVNLIRLPSTAGAYRLRIRDISRLDLIAPRDWSDGEAAVFPALDDVEISFVIAPAATI